VGYESAKEIDGILRRKQGDQYVSLSIVAESMRVIGVWSKDEEKIAGQK